MTARVTYRIDGDIAILGLAQPPVNSLGQAMRAELQQAYRQALADDQVAALVLVSEARIFCGGADIQEFGSDQAFASPDLPSLLSELEASPKRCRHSRYGLGRRPRAGPGLRLPDCRRQGQARSAVTWG